MILIVASVSPCSVEINVIYGNSEVLIFVDLKFIKNLLSNLSPTLAPKRKVAVTLCLVIGVRAYFEILVFDLIPKMVWDKLK